jgi:hypothetical protein
MDAKQLLAEFDRLVQDGTVLYDNDQRTISHVNGGLKVSSLKF